MSDTTQSKPMSATSNTIPSTSATQYRSWGGELFNPKYDNPQRHLDDIIPLVVSNVIVSPKPELPQGEKKSSRLGKLFRDGRLDDQTSTGKTMTKTIFLPRSEYLKWFATDEKGVYIGSEPEKEWSEDELDEMFARYRPKKNDARGGALWDRLMVGAARGL